MSISMVYRNFRIEAHFDLLSRILGDRAGKMFSFETKSYKNCLVFCIYNILYNIFYIYFRHVCYIQYVQNVRELSSVIRAY